MTKILKVTKPFFVMDVDDTFELSQDGDMYVSEYNEGHSETTDDARSISSNYSSTYAISPDYAKTLIDEGYLKEVKNEQFGNFRNVFDEINDMLDAYNEDLNTLDERTADQPACLKVEQETVLRNIIKVLEHLQSLKK